MTVQIIDDIEIGEIPPTPKVIDSVPAMDIAESSLLEYAKQLGNPVAYSQEQNGRLIQHIFPIRTMETDQISSSSKVDLELHTETCFHPYRPDYVMLLCLRGDESAPTTYACLEDILGNIEPEVVIELMKEQFFTTIDKSFRMHGESDAQVKTSVLYNDENGYVNLRFDSSVMSGENYTADLALNELKKIVASNVKEFTLREGQLAIMDNRVTIHGRKHFVARYDGTDRWLMRCMVRSNMPPAEFCDGNIITYSKFG